MNNSIFAKRLRASLEDVNGEVVVSELPSVDEVLQPEGAETVEVVEADPNEVAKVEDEVIAADEASDEADAAIEEADEVQDAAEGLESILTAIRGVKDRGLTPGEAKWAGIAVEAYVGKFLPAGVSLVPSAEAFGGSTSRIRATASLEASVTEMAKNAWQHVIEMLKRAWKWIAAFMVGIFNATKALEKRAEELQRRAKALPDKPTNATMVIPTSVVKNLEVGGQFPKSLDDINKLVSKTNKACDGLADFVIKLTESIALPISAEDAELDDGDALDARLKELTKKTMEDIAKAVGQEFSMKDGVLVSKPFPGNVTYSIGNSKAERFASTRTVSESKSKEAKIATPNKAAIVNLALVSKENAVTLGNRKKIENEFKPSALNVVLDDILKAPKGSTKTSKFARRRGAMYCSAITACANLIGRTTGDNVRVLRNILKVGFAAAAANTGKKAAEEAKA